jgi:hypothetical protein
VTLLGQFVLAFAMARWIDRMIVQRLERVLWERVVLWALLVSGMRKPEVGKAKEAAGDD